MRKVIEFKRYNDFNLIIIILTCMVIFLPIIVYLVRLIAPNIIRCPYYEFTSNPCPFCGITSDIRNMIKGDLFADKYNLISIYVVIGSIIEFIARVTLICNKTKLKDIKLRGNIFKVDFIYHVIIFVLILSYMGSFFIFDLRQF